jgi:hypothetical protein
MNAIEQTKHDGAVLALKRKIDDLICTQKSYLQEFIMLINEFT